MITLQRPGHLPLELEFLLLDFEGTLATDRRVHPKTKDKLNLLSKRMKIYIFTRGSPEVVSEALKKVKGEVIYLSDEEASQGKLNLIRQIGPDRTVAIGNGSDDVFMLEEAALGICVIGTEGAFGEAVGKADVVVTHILDALDFLLKPLRHQATLAR